MTKKYVLTGGPSSGKSSIISALELEGEYVVREAAEDYIRLRHAQGQKTPWVEENFQGKILELLLQREERVPETERVFLDRGAADGLAYQQPGTELYDRILAESENRRYEKIFIVEPLGNLVQNGVRRESYEESLKIQEKLEAVYRNLGYEPILIRKGTLDERVEAVKKAVE
jgi:predicted ATPase